MREYTDSEVIKLLQNNPKLKFKDETGGIASFSKDTEIFIYEKVGLFIPLVFSTKKCKWTLIEQPRNFFGIADEKLSLKRVKVNHPYLKGEKITQAKLNMYEKVMRNKIVNGEYLFFANLLEILSNLLNSEEVAEILKYGEWYVEEV